MIQTEKKPPVNLKLKALIVEKYGTLQAFSRAVQINGGLISEIIHGWRILRPREIEKFCTGLGKKDFWDAMGWARGKKREGGEGGDDS